MPVPVHQWAVVLVRGPKGTFMRFQHHSYGTGTQVLDEYAWPMAADLQTEHQILGELYQGVLDFLAARS